jgi:ribokinase
LSLELVVLGNLLVDDVVFPDGRTRMAEPGGAALYAALGANLWGVGVGVASWRGEDYPAWALEGLAARGIDLSGVRALGAPGLRTWLLYEGRVRRVVHRLEGPAHAQVSPGPEQVPEAWRHAGGFHLAPMPPEVQLALIESLRAGPGERAFVSLDPYLLLRDETLDACRALTARADAFLLSEDELALPAAREDPRGVLRSLAAPRTRYVVFKRGARGGLVLDTRAGRFVEWQARSTVVVDPTGAGDAFAGGWLAGMLEGEPLEDSLRRAVVSASFAIEDWGPRGLLAATPERARSRLREWFVA